MLRWRKLFSIIKSPTARENYSVTFGNLINAGLGFLSIIIISRLLGPASFGIFSAATAVLVLASDVFDLGINAGIIKFASEHFGQGRAERAFQYLKESFKFKLLAAGFSVLLGFIFGPTIATYIFHQPDTSLYIQLSFIGVATTLLFSFSTSVLQSLQRFYQLATLNVLNGLLKFLGVLLLLVIFQLGILGSLAAYIVAPLLAFLVSLFFIERGFWKVPKDTSVRKDIFHFSKWMALFILFSALHARLDVLMLNSLSSPKEVGFYSAASRITFIFPILVSSFGSVMTPKVLSSSGVAAVRAFLAKSTLFLLPVILGIVVLIVLSNPVIHLLYGSSYAPSSDIFKVLLIGMAIFVATSPLTITFYKFNTPRLFALIAAIQFVTTVMTNFYLIPLYQGVGAAISFSFVNLIGFVIALIFVLKRISRHAS